MKKENIKLWQNYYFNNREVKVLRVEAGNMALVSSKLSLSHETTGNQFCIGCQSGFIDGTPNSHSCIESQEIIDTLFEETDDTEFIMWVDIRYLNEHPFEYKENRELKESIVLKKQEIHELNKHHKIMLETHQNKKNSLNEIEKQISDKRMELSSMIEQLKNIHERSADIQLELDKNVSLQGVKLEISVKDILNWIRQSVELEALNVGGVDNWEWYEDSLKNIDVEKKALEILLQYSSKIDPKKEG